ncbi:RDD family protein [Streptomyces sp. MN13]
MSAPTPAPGDDRPREGYYPDPSIPGYVRYWNGAAWVPGTSRPAPADGEPLAPPPGVRPAQPSVEETGPHFFDEDPLDEPAPQEPASAWGADRAHQSGFGGDQDRRVSWGTPDATADPRAAHQPADRTATPDPGGTFVFRRPTPADGGAEPDPTGGTGQGGAPGQGAGAAGQGVVPGQGAGAAGQGAASSHGAGAGAGAGAGFGPVMASGAAGSGAAGPGAAGSGAAGHGGAGSGAAGSGAAGPGAAGSAAAGPGAASYGGAGSSPAGASASGPGAGPHAAGPGAATPGAAGSPADARAGARRDDGTMTFRAVGGPRAAASGTAAAAPASAADPASGAPGFGAGKAAAARAATAQAAQAASAPPAQAGAAGPQQQPAGAGFPARAAQVPQQAAAPTPVTSGPGGGQSSWAQQVHQLAGGAGGAGGDDQPVAPWKPPVEDPFQAAARRQAAARPAGFGKRLAARLIDTVVVAGVTAVAAVPLGGKALDHVQGKVDQAKLSGETVTVWLLDGTTSAYLGIVVAVLLVAGVLYEALPTAKWGRTLGKRLLGLEVRDIEAHEPPSFGAALRRWLVYSVPGLLCVGLVGVLWCLFDKPWRQCWHDKAARTFVAAD